MSGKISGCMSFPSQYRRGSQTTVPAIIAQVPHHEVTWDADGVDVELSQTALIIVIKNVISPSFNLEPILDEGAVEQHPTRHHVDQKKRPLNRS